MSNWSIQVLPAGNPVWVINSHSALISSRVSRNHRGAEDSAQWDAQGKTHHCPCIPLVKTSLTYPKPEQEKSNLLLQLLVWTSQTEEMSESQYSITKFTAFHQVSCAVSCPPKRCPTKMQTDGIFPSRILLHNKFLLSTCHMSHPDLDTGVASVNITETARSFTELNCILVRRDWNWGNK